MQRLVTFSLHNSYKIVQPINTHVMKTNKKIKEFANAMSELLFDMRADDVNSINLSTPNTDELVPENYVNMIIDSNVHISKMKSLIKNDIINHLTQCSDDFKNEKGEYHYTPDVFDFAYAVDSYIEQQYEDEHCTKTVLVCPNCKSDNVHVKMWVNPNTNEVIDSASDGEEDDEWCDDCREHYKLNTVTLKPSAKVIGFQVVGEEHTKEEGNIHPDMAGSFCIYNLEQAREMIENSIGRRFENNWRLLAIWEGDIEEPTFMFNGDLR